MNNNEVKQILTKIVALEDIDKALEDEKLYGELYEALKVMLAEVLEGETLAKALKVTLAEAIPKIIEDEALSETLNRVLFKAIKTESLDKALVKLKEDKAEYGQLYSELDEELRKKLEDDKLDVALEGLLDEALNVMQKEMYAYKKSAIEELEYATTLSYYLEASKTLDWFSSEYRKYGEKTREFIKKHIDTIVESDNPNKILERLQLFQLANIGFPQEGTNRFKEFLDTSLEHLDAFEHLINKNLLWKWGYIRIEGIALANLNLKNISAFIEKPDLAPLKIVTDAPEPINFFTFLSVLWWALINRDSDIQPLISRFITAFKDSHRKYQEYKNYQEELSKVINKYQQIYKSELDGLASKILDKKGAVKDEIDFKELVNDLCALSQLYCTGITLAKKNPIIDKLFEKFNYPNTADPMVRCKLEVLFWIYKGFYGNIDIPGKEFMQQHFDKIMDYDRPREALNAIYLVYFYKLHDKAITNRIIDTVLKDASPEASLKEMIEKLVSKNKYLCFEKGEIELILHPLLRPQSLVSDQQVPEIITPEATTVRLTNEHPIIKGSITSRSGWYGSTNDVNDKPYAKPVVYRP